MRRQDADEICLGDLINLAQDHLAHSNGWTEWLEDYYDPAKSALIQMLVNVGVVTDDDIYDRDGANVMASDLLDQHHAVVGERDAEGYLDNCERCGFSTGWVQPTSLGPDHWGHATSCSSAEVLAWIDRAEFRNDTDTPDDYEEVETP